MQDVTLYRTTHCPYCHLAAKLLERKGVQHPHIIAVDGDASLREEMVRRSGGRRTVPQIFIGAVHVGGYDDLAALDRAGKLDGLLAAGSGPS